MTKIKIKSLLTGTNGVAFIEFEEKGKSKILSANNFIKRHGDWRKYK